MKPWLDDGDVRLYHGSALDVLYCTEILTRWGRDFTRCEQCDAATARPELHHTRYAGATIHDLEIVCGSCNTSKRNLGIA